MHDNDSFYCKKVERIFSLFTLDEVDLLITLLYTSPSYAKEK